MVDDGAVRAVSLVTTTGRDLPRDRLTLLPSPRPRTHHLCTFLRVGALDPAMPSSKRDMAMEMVPATPASLDRSGAMSLGNQLATAARI